MSQPESFAKPNITELGSTHQPELNPLLMEGHASLTDAASKLIQHRPQPGGSRGELDGCNLPGLDFDEKNCGKLANEARDNGMQGYSEPGVYDLGGDQRFARAKDDTQLFVTKNHDLVLVTPDQNVTTTGDPDIESVRLSIAGRDEKGTRITFDDGTVAILHGADIAAVGDKHSRRFLNGYPTRDF